ncbi:UDP-N-acetylglucosamine 2-epimerase, partial [Faecalibacterium prausnitzii]
MEHNFTWKNDGRTKVMIGCGTRPEIIRLAAVIKRCREYFDCCVVYYNQNWDRNLSTVFWEDFELKNTFGEYGPDILVPVVGENLGVTCGNILGRSYELLSELQPEGYLVLGDTNSCLSAISAKRLHIPLFHMEAGNRCKDECLPEETNRR